MSTTPVVLAVVAAIGAWLALTNLGWWLMLRRRRQAEQLIHVGGRLLKRSEWSPEVIEQLQKDYLLPPAKGLHLLRAEVTAACPVGHPCSYRIGIVAAEQGTTDRLAKAILMSKAELPCTECGKLSRISACSPAWQGPFGDWDGAT